MKAIGRLVAVNSTGNRYIEMFFDGKWSNGSWVLENDMPSNHPVFGLFEFMPEDQFCKWIDPNEAGAV